MSVYRRNQDGSWTPASPEPIRGAVARTEFWFRRRGYRRIANLLARFDERGLG